MDDDQDQPGGPGDGHQEAPGPAGGSPGRGSRARDTADRLAEKARVRALETGLERLDGELETVRGVVQDLAHGLEAVATRQAIARPEPAWWPAMDGQEHGQRWSALVAWVRDVLAVRYAREARAAVTRCWAAHPAAVDALTSAWLTWTAAYAPSAEPRDAADWQTRTLPDLLDRTAAELGGCREQCQGPARPPDVGFGAG